MSVRVVFTTLLKQVSTPLPATAVACPGTLASACLEPGSSPVQATMQVAGPSPLAPALSPPFSLASAFVCTANCRCYFFFTFASQLIPSSRFPFRRTRLRTLPCSWWLSRANATQATVALCENIINAGVIRLLETNGAWNGKICGGYWHRIPELHVEEQHKQQTNNHRACRKTNGEAVQPQAVECVQMWHYTV